MIGKSKATNKSATLRSLWEGWKRVARKIGEFQARVLMSLFYFVVLAPFAPLVRWGSDPLAMKLSTPKGWRTKDERGEDAARQS